MIINLWKGICLRYKLWRCKYCLTRMKAMITIGRLLKRGLVYYSFDLSRMRNVSVNSIFRSMKLSFLVDRLVVLVVIIFTGCFLSLSIGFEYSKCVFEGYCKGVGLGHRTELTVATECKYNTEARIETSHSMEHLNRYNYVLG